MVRSLRRTSEPQQCLTRRSSPCRSAIPLEQTVNALPVHLVFAGTMRTFLLGAVNATRASHIDAQNDHVSTNGSVSTCVGRQSRYARDQRLEYCQTRVQCL